MEYSEEYRETGSSSDDASRDQAAEKRRSYRINPELDPENDQTNDDTENDNVIEKESKRLPPPPRSAEEMAAQRKIVRSMWELASVFDFISVSFSHLARHFKTLLIKNECYAAMYNTFVWDVVFSLVYLFILFL